jgi:hypothetical protein
MKYLLSIVAASLCLGWAAVSLAAETASGTVLESFDAAGYTYLKLDVGGEETWLATRPLKVSAGDTVQYAGGNLMTDFHSKSLDRTFDKILFVDDVALPGQPAPVAAPQSPGKNSMGMDPHAMTAAAGPVAAPAPGEIPRLDDGKTIGEIFAQRSELETQQVAVRARVMKVSAHILGKNWITLQDGSGAEPDNRLMVTSAESVRPGDLVVARGVVHKDVDIGSGYSYKVLLEETTFIQGSE